jgi:hypothetical protein
VSIGSRGSLRTEGGSPLCRVQAVSFVAGGRLGKRIVAEVDGVTVSVSSNQLHELCQVAIVEHADAAIGQSHLLKRSLLLFRAWALHDSHTFATFDLLFRSLPSAQAAAATGSGGTALRTYLANHAAAAPALAGLSWRACVTLMMWVFVRRGPHITQPFQALAWLLADLAAFNWDRYALSIGGAVPLSELASASTAQHLSVQIDQLTGGSTAAGSSVGGSTRRGSATGKGRDRRSRVSRTAAGGATAAAAAGAATDAPAAPPASSSSVPALAPLPPLGASLPNRFVFNPLAPPAELPAAGPFGYGPHDRAPDDAIFRVIPEAALRTYRRKCARRRAAAVAQAGGAAAAVPVPIAPSIAVQPGVVPSTATPDVLGGGAGAMPLPAPASAGGPAATPAVGGGGGSGDDAEGSIIPVPAVNSGLASALAPVPVRVRSLAILDVLDPLYNLAQSMGTREGARFKQTALSAARALHQALAQAAAATAAAEAEATEAAAAAAHAKAAGAAAAGAAAATTTAAAPSPASAGGETTPSPAVSAGGTPLAAAGLPPAVPPADAGADSPAPAALKALRALSASSPASAAAVAASLHALDSLFAGCWARYTSAAGSESGLLGGDGRYVAIARARTLAATSNAPPDGSAPGGGASLGGGSLSASLGVGAGLVGGTAESLNALFPTRGSVNQLQALLAQEAAGGDGGDVAALASEPLESPGAVTSSGDGGGVDGADGNHQQHAAAAAGLLPHASTSLDVTTSGIFGVLSADLRSLYHSIDFCSFLLDAEVTSPALLSLASEILSERGPIPVGEIGKLLQEATSNGSLSSTLKERFGGLKRFLEAYPQVFV